MAKFVVIIDAQNDFITGNLSSDEAMEAYDRIKNYLTNWPESEDVFIFTQDTHEANDYAGSIEGKRVVNHCRKDYWGWKIPGAALLIFFCIGLGFHLMNYGSKALALGLHPLENFSDENDDKWYRHQITDYGHNQRRGNIEACSHRQRDCPSKF